MRHLTLGAFELGLSDEGKLESLVAGAAELLYRGEYLMDIGGGSIFGVRGWDECFPTIEAFGGCGVMGELVRRAPELVVSVCGATQTWRTEGFTARREFTLDESGELAVAFRAENTGHQDLPFVWASHALFSADELASVELPDGSIIDAFSKDGTCVKRFVPADGFITLSRKDLSIELETDAEYWGLWLNRGGWPADVPAGFCCIGIEATNAASDAPKGGVLRPGEVFERTVRVEIVE